MKRCYEIVIQTQLGKRKGLLNLDVMHEEIEGSFCFLTHTLPVNGKMLSNGNMELFGTFITLQKTHSYHACGMIEDTDIHLKLYEGNHCYQAEGKEIKEDHK